jgi:hypothetical protein
MRYGNWNRQVGSGWGGMPHGGRSGYDRQMRGGYDRADFLGGSPDFRGGPHGGNAGNRQRYGGDYWWIGEHETQRRGRGRSYDEAYARFDRQNRPRFSPVGGMHPAMGGSQITRRLQRPLRDSARTSEWTRWF